jgi:hypothetical protein
VIFFSLITSVRLHNAAGIVTWFISTNSSSNGTTLEEAWARIMSTRDGNTAYILKLESGIHEISSQLEGSCSNTTSIHHLADSQQETVIWFRADARIHLVNMSSLTFRDLTFLNASFDVYHIGKVSLNTCHMKGD